MKKQIIKNSQPEVDPQTLNFVKALCARITQAIQDIDGICTDEANPKPQSSSLGSFQGIGLFTYIKSNQQQLKKKFPAFTQDEIFSILLAQWQNLTDKQKVQFCSKFNFDKFKSSKKLRKLDKQSEKYFQNLENSKKHDQIVQSSKIKQCENNNIKDQGQKQKCQVQVIQQEESIHKFFDQQKKKNVPSNITPQKSANKKPFQIKTQINTIISDNSLLQNINLPQSNQIMHEKAQSLLLQKDKQMKEQIVNKFEELISTILPYKQTIQQDSSVIPIPSANENQSLNSLISGQVLQNEFKNQKEDEVMQQEINQKLQFLESAENQQLQISFGKLKSHIPVEQQQQLSNSQQSLQLSSQKIQSIEQTPVFNNLDQADLQAKIEPQTAQNLQKPAESA